MARARNIKPGFFKNDTLAEVPPLGRILFAGLWTIADREGRLEDRPKRIKVEILPYDDCCIDTLLGELSRRGFITRYVVDTCAFIQITNWKKHQDPHVKEAASTIPAPDEHGASTVLAPNKPETSPEVAPLIPSSLIPDSLFSPLPPSPGGNDTVTPVTPKRARPLPVPEGFEEFWKLYPKNAAKQEAVKAWTKLSPGDRQKAIAAVPAYAAAMAGKDPGFIKNASGWLNGRRWEDEVAAPVVVPPPPLTAKEKWQKVSPAEAAEWVRIEAMRAQERLESRAHYREMLPTLPPEKITRLLTVILPETDPEFAAELSAEGYR